MKKIPLFLLLIAPYAFIFGTMLFNTELPITVWPYGIVLVLGMVYAFVLPRLGYSGKQLLFWNMLLKLTNVPMIVILLLFSWIFLSQMEHIAGLLLFFGLTLWLPSTVYGLSGMLRCRKTGQLSKGAVVFNLILQLIPSVAMIDAIILYIYICCSKKETSAVEFVVEESFVSRNSRSTLLCL